MSGLGPDCAAGKHTACRGEAWDDTADAEVECACDCHMEKPASLRRVIARAIFDDDWASYTSGVRADAWPEVCSDYLANADVVIEALMAECDVEWGVRWDDGFYMVEDEHAARKTLERFPDPNGQVMRQIVCPWEVVPNE